MKTRKEYNKPETLSLDFFSGEDLMIGIGEGSTPDQFGKGSQGMEQSVMSDEESTDKRSVWEE